MRYLEVEKQRAEIEKLRAETRLSEKNANDRRSFVERYAPAGNFVLALVAVVTLGLNIFTASQARKSAEAEELAEAVLALSNDAPISRLSGLARLKETAASNTENNPYIASIALAFETEESELIRNELLAVLLRAPRTAAPALADLRHAANARSVQLITEWGSSYEDVYRAQEDKADDAAIADLIKESKRRLAILRENQRRVVRLSDAIRKVTCDIRTGCPMDLSRTWLRGFSFAEQPFDLTGAVFAGAGLSHADFFGADLTGADFSGATLDNVDFAHATLDGVVFVGATTALTDASVSQGEVERCTELNGTRFKGGTANDVTFDDADVSGANFLEFDISDAQLDKVKAWRGAVLPDALAKRLGYTNPDPISGTTQQTNGRPHCIRPN